MITDRRLRRATVAARAARRNVSSSRAGFTLIEVMVALAILGMSAMVLLDAHYSALSLHADTREQVLAQQLIEEAAGLAEVQVMAGTMTGAGTFGKQFPDCSYTYTAQPYGGQQAIPLYEVIVTVTGLEKDTEKDSKANTSMTFYVYNVGQ